MPQPLLILLNSLIAFFIFFGLSDYSNKVSFSGDSVEYQSAAVNYIYGHGFMMFGGIEEFENYQFVIKENNEYNWDKEAFLEIIHFDTTNGPSYTFFIALIYKVFGVNPYYVKIIQLLLICFGASMLIPISKILFKNNAVLIGILASWLFMVSTYKHANIIYAEPLLVFLFSFLCFFWINYKIKKNNSSFLPAVIFLAICVLSKGIFYFLFGFIVLLEFLEFLKHKKLLQLRHLAVLIIGVPLLISPYIIWQNHHINQEEINRVSNLIQLNHSDQLEDHIMETQGVSLQSIQDDKIQKGISSKLDLDLLLIKELIQQELISNWVIISSQGDYVLLTSNNEYSLDGDWHPESLENPNSFYNQLNPKLTTIEKLICFYTTYPEAILPTFTNKFKRAFWFSSTAILLLLTSSIMLLKSLLPQTKVIRLLFTVLLLISMLLSFISKNAFISLLENNLPLLFTLSVFGFIALLSQLRNYNLRVLIPFILSPILISIIFYGYFRIILPYYLILALLMIFMFIESLYMVLGSTSKTD